MSDITTLSNQPLGPSPRPRVSRRGSAAALMVLLTGTGCGAGAVGKVVRPTQPTAGEALGTVDVECRPEATDAQPLVVDLPSSGRVDLEVAMKEGVAVVAYDCKTMRLLTGCKATGSYDFAGVSRKEEVIKLEDQGEIAANLPFNGVKISGGLERGAALDLALVLIGKHSTMVDAVRRFELAGRCDGATHFVRSASVGAFALDVGTRGEARLVADVFGAHAGAASTSRRKSVNHDGDLAECRSATPDDATPPAQCRSAIRLELVPIAATGPEVDATPVPATMSLSGLAPLADPCPEGFVLTAGKCAPRASAQVFLCGPDDRQTCEDQCAKGSTGSCYNLGHLLTGVKDLCKESKADNCLAVGVVPDGDPKYAQYVEGAKAYEKACEGDVAAACYYVGRHHEDGVLGKSKDDVRADQQFERACMQGHAMSCLHLTQKYEGKDRNDPRAVKYAQRACDLGLKPGCFSAVAKYLKGEGTPKRPDAAEAILTRTCDAGEGKRCAELGMLKLEGHLGPKDVAKALAVFSRGCELKYASSCVMQAQAHLGQWGVPLDREKAREAFQKGCAAEGEKSKACVDLAKRLAEP
ncbi:tetratricopeptide repeat protein [Nannocystis punicea]|uniref:Tetratricopeptide repeat protein n=1 Tax=Nannocystis punicea TaxID=2995304 RepID=A0ABY7GV50_9BACT|nr:tetratricopeptide repeat protein [Nannocystis poenicansa]WAS90831.1 tetratricopeptide repeat protein [Nannocystis poenicansa]